MRPVSDVLICLRFFSRLPVPTSAREETLGRGGLAEAAAMVPAAGALIGLFPALTLVCAAGLGLSASLAALIALASLVLVTGALHEDALADCADGFGGGRTRERKLEILRDSRIGAFGAVALVLSLMLRASALTDIADHGASLAVASLVVVAALSRTASLAPLLLLPPARADGLGAAATRPDRSKVAVAAALAVATSALLWIAGFGGGQTIVAVAVAAILALAMCALAWRQIGGQTGDVAGATQQIVEIGVLLVLAVGSAPG